MEISLSNVLSQNTVLFLEKNSFLSVINKKIIVLALKAFALIFACYAAVKIFIYCKKEYEISKCVQALSQIAASGNIDRLILFLKNYKKKVTELNLSSFKNIDDAKISQLVALCPHLQRLFIENCDQITDQGLLSIQNLTSLTFLSLKNGCSGITDQGLQYISTLPQLSDLRMNDCSRITDHGLQFISTSPKLSLLSMDNCNGITDRGLQFISSLKLYSLSIGDCINMTGQGLKYLTSINLSSLELKNAPLIDPNDLGCIGKFANLSSLEFENFDQLTDDVLKKLEFRSYGLFGLSLKGCKQITDEGVESILSKCPRLNRFRLVDCQNVSNSAPEFLTKLNRLPYQLGIGDLKLSDCTQIRLNKSHFNIKSLWGLFLNNCSSITDECLEVLQGCKSLSYLDLSNCTKITDEGIKHLQKLPRLQTLQLSGCQGLTDKSLDILKKFSHLRTLDIEKCQGMSDGEIEKFREIFVPSSSDRYLSTDTGVFKGRSSMVNRKWQPAIFHP